MSNASSLVHRPAPPRGLVRVHLGSGRLVYVQERCVRPWRLPPSDDRVVAGGGDVIDGDVIHVDPEDRCCTPPLRLMPPRA